MEGVLVSHENSPELYGIHSIDHFALEVPSLSRAEEFYRSFGLNVGKKKDSLELRTFSSDHVWGRIYSGNSKRLAYLSVNCDANNFEKILKRAHEFSVRQADDSQYKIAEGVWLYDNDGNAIQVKIGEKTSPSELTPLKQEVLRAGERGVSGRSDVKTIHPRRLSHVLLFTPDLNRAINFYSQILGLRLSDRSRDMIAFMHAPYGSDHHLVAFAASGGKGFHHSSWDVQNIDEVGLGAEQMRRAGYPEGWGTGRHVLGSNYFHYVRDPWGSFVEYSAGIDFIPQGFLWPQGDFPPEDALYLWGPEVPSYFTHNTEV